MKSLTNAWVGTATVGFDTVDGADDTIGAITGDEVVMIGKGVGTGLDTLRVGMGATVVALK